MRKIKIPKIKFSVLINLSFAILIVFFSIYFLKLYRQKIVLSKIIQRLSAESRIAQVIVTKLEKDSATGKEYTTIKFLEYDSQGKPIQPKYFTFAGNIIQFQALVIRFEDIYVRNADKLRGKSAYIFWKVFSLDGKNTREYEINKAYQIPTGYKINRVSSRFEENLWREFWDYALNAQKAKKMGIKCAQIEAPGTKFVPGIIYTIKIEHDGGLRIESKPLEPILKGEKIEF